MSSFTLFREKKDSIPLIRIMFGSVPIYATTTRSPVFWKGNTYIPEPAIDVKLPKQGISLDEEACVVTLPLDRGIHPGIQSMARILATPRTAPKIEIDVFMMLKASEDEVEVKHLYNGVLDQSRRNPSGKKAVIELEFQSELSANLDDISLGRRADPDCDAIFGSTMCYVDNQQFFTSPGPWFKLVRRAWVTASFPSYRNSREVLLTLHLPSHPGIAVQDPLLIQPKDWWVRSFLVADDVKIPIQEWRWDPATGLATNSFVLNRIPPVSWETPGKVFLLQIDCPRTPQACIDRNNVNNFSGLGHGIPAYNPTLEVRDG